MKTTLSVISILIGISMCIAAISTFQHSAHLGSEVSLKIRDEILAAAIAQNPKAVADLWEAYLKFTKHAGAVHYRSALACLLLGVAGLVQIVYGLLIIILMKEGENENKA